MARDKQELIINAKMGWLNHRLGIDFQRALAAGTTGNPAGLLASLTFERTEESLAWILIFRALLRTLREVGAEGLKKATNPEAAFADLGARVDEALAEEVIRVGPDFFRAPADLPIVGMARNVVREWLQAIGVSKADADDLTRPSSFRTAFTEALEAVRLKQDYDYGRLNRLFEGSFEKAMQTEKGWEANARILQRQFRKALFATEIGLHQLYVPLRASWDERTAQSSTRKQSPKTRRIVVDLEAALQGWLGSHDQDDAVRLVSGGPGYGKSSCLAAIAAKLADEGRRVLFVDLNGFNPGHSLRWTIDDKFRTRLGLPEGPLEALGAESRLTLIFDGLDELAMQGKGGQSAAADFLGNINTLLEDFNHQRRRLDAIIAGREIIVDAHKDRFKPRQILHLMAYFLTDEDRRGAWNPARIEVEARGVDHLDDQRPEWWAAYYKATGLEAPGRRHSQSLPYVSDHLAPLSAVPLLNYLIAWVYTSARGQEGGPDLKPDARRNDLYARLINEVWHRPWSGRVPHPVGQHLSFEAFERVLEEIALAMWQAGRTRTISAEKVREACQRAGLADALARMEDEARSGAANLLTMFYFRRTNQSQGEDTFEFTHRTFGEYLLACRLRREIDSYAQHLGGGEGVASLLDPWLAIAGPAPLDGDIVEFLREELLHHEAVTPEARRRVLEDLFDHMLAPHKDRLDWDKITRSYRNAEEALFVILRAAWRLPWPKEHDFGAFLRRLQFGAANEERVLALGYLERLDLRGQVLARANLRRANLEVATLQGVDLSHADLTGAFMFEAAFEGACLDFAILDHGTLSEAKLQGASLRNARMVKAYVESAHFHKACMTALWARDTALAEANIGNALLSRAELEGANFLQSYARGADFTGANMKGCTGDEGSFAGATFVRADLEGIRFRAMVFDDADFTGANLERADLRRCSLKGATLSPEQLREIRTDETTTLPDGSKGPYRPEDDTLSDVG